MFGSVLAWDPVSGRLKARSKLHVPTALLFVISVIHKMLR